MGEGGREGRREEMREGGRERGKEGVLSCYPSLSSGHSELMKEGRGSERGKRVKL